MLLLATTLHLNYPEARSQMSHIRRVSKTALIYTIGSQFKAPILPA
jgi:hypothetical protein